jgi:predicted HicB family RNase H-like nuclease
MKKQLEYKGYTAEIVYSEEDKCFIGEVILPEGSKEEIVFHGKNKEECEQVFQEVLDFYLSPKE